MLASVQWQRKIGEISNRKLASSSEGGQGDISAAPLHHVTFSIPFCLIGLYAGGSPEIGIFYINS